MLAEDEEERREGTGSELLFQDIAQQLSEAGFRAQTSFAVAEPPGAGLSDRELVKRAETLEYQLATSPAALARGDITVVQEQLDGLLEDFQINLDRASAAYRKLGMAVLKAHVRALRDIEKRNDGEPIDTPAPISPPASAAAALTSAQEAGSLREAFEGWKNERERPAGTVHEYGRAVEMFIQLHGNLRLTEMRRSHARAFREALQSVPRVRTRSLLKATLPQLSEHGRANPATAKVSAGTVNKQLGAVQAIAGWALPPRPCARRCGLGRPLR
jgi:hypothetical protein